MNKLDFIKRFVIAAASRERHYKTEELIDDALEAWTEIQKFDAKEVGKAPIKAKSKDQAS